MLKCRDCFHYKVCPYHIDEETKMTINECYNFKDKTKIVELPCKVEDTVYFILNNKVYERRILDLCYDFKDNKLNGVIVELIDANGEPFKQFVEYQKFKKFWYLTSEEAEEVLDKNKL